MRLTSGLNAIPLTVTTSLFFSHPISSTTWSVVSWKIISSFLKHCLRDKSGEKKQKGPWTWTWSPRFKSVSSEVLAPKLQRLPNNIHFYIIKVTFIFELLQRNTSWCVLIKWYLNSFEMAKRLHILLPILTCNLCPCTVKAKWFWFRETDVFFYYYSFAPTLLGEYV